jgi:hypothetical protein
MPDAAVHIFGIRHHGPGSAGRLLEALDALQPAIVLIEGPADASHLLPMLSEATMAPPVALLAYAADEPSRAAFWPLAIFSPEYQAACWAARHQAAMRFIDLPASWLLAPPEPEEARALEEPIAAARTETDPIARDPIGALAKAGGYEDGESWWRDVVEENPAPAPIFAAIAEAMTALREASSPIEGQTAKREAHMRLEIAKAAKETDRPIAVVCGAWHAPALRAKASAADRALIKGAPRQKIVATWAPWTSPRLAFASGYSAGVPAPGWCAHLWTTPGREVASRWLARIAAALREDGHFVSTASLIEAERLAVALAAMRARPAPGFEELREATIACLAFGERLIWDRVAHRVLIGSEVGAIPANAPLAPLLEDLQQTQKRLRLKPEALERELSVDLRSESGAERSTLLHRLRLLDTPWGKLVEAGRSRGTFRESWILRWEPEFAVRLIENLVYGSTIAEAAAGRLKAEFGRASDLKTLADLIFAALAARLPDAVEYGVSIIEKRVAQTSDCNEMLAALAPLANVLRYGEARQRDADQLAALFARILAQGALALPYAARGLDQTAAGAMRGVLKSADSAIALVEVEGDQLVVWRDALHVLTEDAATAPPVAGAAARLLSEAEVLTPEATAILLGKALSPGRRVADAAGFFEGFFDGAGERLIHDGPLRDALDRWVQSLDEENFTTHLPLFRRAFSNLDRMQRRRLLDALFGRASVGPPGRALVVEAEALWPRHFERVTALLIARPPHE